MLRIFFLTPTLFTNAFEAKDYFPSSSDDEEKISIAHLVLRVFTIITDCWCRQWCFDHDDDSPDGLSATPCSMYFWLPKGGASGCCHVDWNTFAACVLLQSVADIGSLSKRVKPNLSIRATFAQAVRVFLVQPHQKRSCRHRMNCLLRQFCLPLKDLGRFYSNKSTRDV